MRVSSMLGMLCFYDVNKKPPDDLGDAIVSMVDHFLDKHGYYPREVHIRKDERNGLDLEGITVVERENNLQPHHFILYEVIKRKPRLDMEKEPL